MSHSLSLDIPVAGLTQSMTPLAFDENFHYFHFDSASLPPLEAVRQVIRDAWRHDYGKRNETVFDYNIPYLNWLFQPNTFDGIWVTTPSGQPAGLIVLTRRTISTKNASIPAHYGSMLSVSQAFRGHKIGQRMYELFFEKLVKHGSALFGVMDGESGGKRVSDHYVNSTRQNIENPLWNFLSEPYTIWATCRDMKLLHAYMPLPAKLAKIALHPWVRKLIEFRFKQPHRPAYEVGLIEPDTAEKRLSIIGTWFPASDVAALYGLGHEKTAGTYRVRFSENIYCDICYTFHNVVKQGLPDACSGHIQLIHSHGVSPAQIQQSIRAVTHELMENGAIAVLVHHTKMVHTLDLLRTGFLPSGRKIKYYFGWYASTAAPCKLEEPLFLDLL